MLSVAPLLAATTILAPPPLGAFVPAPGPYTPMPYYFSGTDCRASGRVIPAHPGGGGNQGISSATLYINNNPTSTFTATPGLEPAEIILSARFDSTHFANGSISVRIDATPLLGPPLTATNTSIVKNRALIYEHHDFNDGAEDVYDALNGTNFQRSKQDSNSWTETTLFNDMDSNCSVLYVSSHGRAEAHWNCDFGDIFSSDYLTARTADIGSGLPPFNSTQKPPIALAFFYSCHVGDTNVFNKACYPYSNSYGDTWVNQCVVAYPKTVDTSQAGAHSGPYFSKLVEGQTAYTARAYLFANADHWGLHVKDYSGGSWRTLTSGDISIWGDEKTRIKSVYTGSNVAPVGWWKL